MHFFAVFFLPYSYAYMSHLSYALVTLLHRMHLLQFFLLTPVLYFWPQVPFSISRFIASGVGVSVPTEQLFRSLVLTLLIPLILGKVISSLALSELERRNSDINITGQGLFIYIYYCYYYNNNFFGVGSVRWGWVNGF